MKKMKKKTSLIFILSLLITHIWGKNCGGGSFETGTYSYSVEDGKSCCLGAPSGPASYSTWEMDKAGVWELRSLDFIDPGKAQKNSCK